eukprot:2500818-Prymnesium_polylepis.2
MASHLLCSARAERWLHAHRVDRAVAKRCKARVQRPQLFARPRARAGASLCIALARPARQARSLLVSPLFLHDALL